MVEGVGHRAASAGMSHPGEQKTQKRGHVYRRAHGRAGACADGVLIYHNGGGEVPNFVYLRTVIVRHFVPQEQRVALLPFPCGFHGNRVESQGAFPGAGHAREYHKLSLRDRHVDVLQIVLRRAEDFNAVRCRFRFHPPILPSCKITIPSELGPSYLISNGRVCQGRSFLRRTRRVRRS